MLISMPKQVESTPHARSADAGAALPEQAARLRLAITRTARRLRQTSAASELGAASVAALATIERRGPLTPSELADAERIKRPTATRIVARLADAGLIDRAADPSDGRCSLISVTPAGAEHLRMLRRRKDAYLAQRLAELPERDVATLRRAASILERMLEEGRS